MKALWTVEPLAQTAGYLTTEPPSADPCKQHTTSPSQCFNVSGSVGLRPGTEYGMGVTAVKEERESLPTTTNAVTGRKLSVLLDNLTGLHIFISSSISASFNSIFLLLSFAVFLVDSHDNIV